MTLPSIDNRTCIVRDTDAQPGRTRSVAPGKTAAQHLNYGRIILGSSDAAIEVPAGGMETGLVCLKGQAAGSTERWSERLVEEARRTISTSDASSDDATLASIWRLLAWAHGTSCRWGLATASAEHAIEHARLANDARQIGRAAGQYAIAALHGPTPVSEAIRRCEDLASEAQGDRRTQGLVTSHLAALLAMRGDFEEARRLYVDAQAMLGELGPTVVGASTSLASSVVERLSGDLAAAERELRRDYEALTELGEKYLLSSVAAELARVLYDQ